MNKVLGAIAIIGLGLVLALTATLVVRWFSNQVTTVTLIEPAPHVQCAKMVTADGAAISCWRTDR